MAQDAIQHNVFNFVALRTANSVSKENKTRRFISDKRPVEETTIGELVGRDPAPSHEDVMAFTRERSSSLGFTIEGPSSPIFEQLESFRKLIEASRDGEQEELIHAIENEMDGSIGTFLESSSDLEFQLWDWLYVGYLLNTETPIRLETLINGLRTLHFLRLLIDDPQIVDQKSEREQVMRATPVLPAEFNPLVQGGNDRPRRQPQPKVEPTETEKKTFKSLSEEYATLFEAAQELPTLQLENQINTSTKVVKTVNQDGDPITRRLTVANSTVRIKPEAFNNLSEGSKTALQRFGTTAETPNLASTALAIQHRQEVVHNQIMSLSASNPLVIKSGARDLSRIPGIAGLFDSFHEKDINKVPPVSVEPRKLIKPLGIGDLLVVKQELKKYVAGEVAHIENVLKGESKERNHRVLDRTETIVISTQETVEETEKDTQTTERFELKKESEKTIQENMSLQAGVTISASYGPVSMGASADFAYSTSSSDTTRTASNFARDVVERSVSKVQKRVKEERTTKNLHEVEEINKHGLDNTTGGGHITGIYRWVDKIYEAQIYNYGKRLMFEFILPEPAAFYIYSQDNNPAKTIDIPKPKELPEGFSANSITPATYRTYAAYYEVQGLNPPPVQYKSMTVSLDQNSIDNGKTISKSVKDLVVPDGYHLIQMEYSVSLIYEKYPHFDIIIGDTIYPVVHDKRARQVWHATSPGHVSESSLVSVSINGYDVNSYSANVSILCEVNKEVYQLWQNQVYEKIVAARQVKVAEYEQKRKAAEVSRGVVIQGRNPRANREIEKTELKKLSITMMTGQYYIGFNSMWEQDRVLPEVYIADAIEEGKFIQFFEQAFEWTQATYLFYPYFWGKRSNWIRNANLDDTDPLFAKFLQAGSARVVVPVHPAYNDAVMYYLETGKLWSGGDSPRIGEDGQGDDLFISIADELRNQTDDLANAVKVGDPWEITLPTTLVWLQPGPELPDFTV